MSWLTSAWRSTFDFLGADGYDSSNQERKKKALKQIKHASDAGTGYESGNDGSQSSAERALQERSAALLQTTGPLRDIQNQAMADLEDPASRIDDAIGRGRTDVHAKIAEAGQPRTIGDITGQGLVRAKALSRVTDTADSAMKKRDLQRRIAIAGFGRQRAALALGQGQVGVDLAAKSRQAALDRSIMTGNAYSNAAGSVIGAATNYGVDAWRQRADLNSEYNRPMVNNLIASGNEQI